jgi:CheY-like chemotaxis protein
VGPPRLRGFKAIVVDDEMLIADALSASLEEQGVDVVGVAYTYDDASQLLEEQPRSDLAFIDLKLGKALSGVRLAQRAGELGIQVIAMTGSRLPADLEGVALLTKPFSMESVRRILDMLRPREGK